MPRCAKCRKPIGFVQFCPRCGARRKLDRLARLDQKRFESFGSAILETYSAGPESAHRRNFTRIKTPLWVTLAACLLVVMFAGMLQRTRHQTPQPAPPVIVAQRAIVARKTAVPRTPPPPSATPAPTARPSPTPTNTPAVKVTPTPFPTAVLSRDDAPALVQSNRELTVGKKGSCGGDDVTIDVRGFTRGCTLFGLVSSGPLANGRGTVLIVPVSSSEDIADVTYGLLYIRANIAATARFLGLLTGDGSRPLIMRVQNGIITEQNGAHKEHFTFDGRRVAQVRG
jgi:hypothetical protein